MKWFLFSAIMLSSLFFCSCSEDFMPKTTVEDKYVMYSVFSNINTDAQVYISHIYDIDGYDPTKFSERPVIKADVTVKTNSHNYKLLETRMRTDSQVMYTLKYLALEPGENVNIKAVLPNGTVLSSSATALQPVYTVFSYPLENGFTSQINRFIWGDTMGISWKSNSLNNLYFVSLSVYYSQMINGVETFFTKQIPVDYIKRNGINEPVYPSYQYTKSIAYKYTAIDSAIASISGGEQDKSKFKLYWLNLEIMEYDKNLSDYYSSIHGYLDRFSIRLDESVYSNIEGGIGVFGMKNITKQTILFNFTYADLFKYQVYSIR